MTFSLMDIILLVVLGLFTLAGLYFGFFHTLGSLVGAIFSIFATGYAMPYVSAWLGAWIPLSPPFQVVLFVVLFLIISRLVGFAFWILDETIGIVTRLPFISSINHLLGGFFGFVEGVIALGVLIYVINTYIPSGAFTTALAGSPIAGWVVTMTGWLTPLLPF
jgi:uncharacterized membrane protein required for colicin V production